MKNSKLKINYGNEYYKSNIIALVILSIVIFVISPIIIITNGMFGAIINGDISSLIFILIFLSIAIIPGIFIFKDYRKKKQQRNMNLYIMNNGICVEGKVISIRYIYTSSEIDDHLGHHNTISEVEFVYNSSKKILMVEQLLIKEKDIKKYENKKVKVYIYNNMHYVDIIN